MKQTKKRSLKDFWLVALVVIAVLCTGVGFLAGSLIISPQQQKMQAAPPVPTLITKKIQYRKLSNNIITRGTVQSQNSIFLGLGCLQKTGKITDPQDGVDSILTKSFVKVGENVRSGTNLLEISGRPFFVMQGQIPVYRDIMPGDSGDDVKQLQQNLRLLGLYGEKINGKFDTKTQDAVKRFYKLRGYTPNSTTSFSDSAPEDAPEPSSSPSSSSAPKSKNTYKNIYIPKVELQFIPQLPSRVIGIASDVGFSIPPTLAILSSSQLDVISNVPDDQAGLIKAGTKVNLYVNGSTPISGTVSSQDNINADSQDNADGQDSADSQDNTDSSGTNFIIHPSVQPDISKLGEDIKVVFTTASTSQKVLAVPLGAISSDQSGKSYITLVGKKEQLTKEEVNIGISGNNLVQINPVNPGVVKEDLLVLIGG